MLKITLKRSLIGCPDTQHRTARALGLGKTGSSVLQQDTEAIRGSLHKLRHLLVVETLAEEPVAAAPKAASRKKAAAKEA